MSIRDPLPTYTADGTTFVIRGMLGDDSDTYYPWPQVMRDPDLRARTLPPIRRELKEALWGLAAIHGEHALLQMCAEVIAEDFDPHGPQTTLASDFRDDLMGEAGR